MTPFITLAFVLLTFTVLVSCTCNYGTSLFPRGLSVPISKFGFNGLQGPLNWHGLNKTANELCAKGKHQSPIVLYTRNKTANEATFSIPSYLQGAVFENLGTTVEVVVNGTLVDNNKSYNLKQFHFHTPSEHRIDSAYSPIESHFVFQAAAFLIELGLSDLLLISLFSTISATATPGEATLTGPLFFEALESHFSNNEVFRYSGSLTAPPCTEGVSWIVSAAPLYIDAETYTRVKDVVKFNSRYTQNVPGGINLLQNAVDELASA